MTTINDLLKRNSVLATTHDPQPTVADVLGKVFVRPKILVMTCVDPRCTPDRFLGVKDMEIVCFRNVCGHFAPQLPEIVGLDQVINFEEVMIIHHTDCGSLYFDEKKFRETLVARAPDQANVIEGLEFGTISDVKESVFDDMKVLRASPLVRQHLKDVARGFVYDIKTGLLEEVFP